MSWYQPDAGGAKAMCHGYLIVELYRRQGLLHQEDLDMALRPLGETGTAGQALADKSDATHRALSLLETAEQVARRTLEEAHEEAQRLIGMARVEAERIRAEARADAPELQRATEQLLVEQQRTLDVVEALRDQLGSLLEAHQARTQESDG
jgi:cell division septum initiation protein DivIVA